MRWKHLISMASAFLLGAPGAVTAQTTTIYVETFDRFAGPPDFDDGTFQVHWCLNGAAVAGGSFCGTGGALRLDGPGDDPVLWVHVGEAGCSELTLSFDYSQFAPTATELRALLSPDDTLRCAAPVERVAAALDVTGGVCTTVTWTTSIAGARSFYWRFDHGGPASALFLDNLAISVAGCAHPCCETGPAGCEDPAVEACVCAADPFCCREQWDDLCVLEVQRLGCGTCDGQGAGCVTVFAADFGTVYLPGGVCPNLPGLFEGCEGAGPYLTAGTACGGSGDMAMRFGSGFPYSSATTPCLDFSDAPHPAVAFRYTKIAGNLGPRIEAGTGGGPFRVVWSAPLFPGDGCLEATVDLSAFGGLPEVRLRFSSGSSVENGAAFDDIAVLPAPSHGCCETGAAGCDDQSVQACVCSIDPFCCRTEWDGLCVQEVTFHACGSCGGAADLNGDGTVDVQDLLQVLLHWGPCIFSPCPGDADGSGVVDVSDLVLVILAWGTAG